MKYVNFVECDSLKYESVFHKFRVIYLYLAFIKYNRYTDNQHENFPRGQHDGYDDGTALRELWCLRIEKKITTIKPRTRGFLFVITHVNHENNYHN